MSKVKYKCLNNNLSKLSWPNENRRKPNCSKLNYNNVMQNEPFIV